MDISHAVAAFLDHRRAKRLSPHSIERYSQAIQRWQRWRLSHQLPDAIDTVDAEELRAFLLYLLYEHIPHCDNPRRAATTKAGMAPASVLSTRNVLRALWTFAAAEGWLRADQVEYFKGDRLPRPIQDLGDRPFWDQAIVDALLSGNTGRSAEERARNAAIIRLIFESGMRLDELCRLEEGDDFQLDQRAARITGKGGKRRWVFWCDDAAAALAAYLDVRRGEMGGRVFRSTGPAAGPLGADAVRNMVKRLAQRADVTLPPQAPVHAGRHGFAHAMIDGGAEISELAQLMGHSDVNTTYRYLHERRDRLQAIHRQASAAARNR